MMKFWREGTCAVLVTVVVGFSSARAPGDLETGSARRILEATGVKGGLVVHLGCGNGKLTAALRANDRYMVHGLETNAKMVEAARGHIRSTGHYGRVSVDRWNGKRLPYVDNLVNLLVAENEIDVPVDEILRVLAPNGVAYIQRGGDWVKTVKPRPAEIDEWTHYLHDSGNNAVAHDSVVGPPRRLQWVGSPRWARHHDRMASLSALVSAGGRIFYIIDEGPTASILLPPNRMLVARDAFNGVVLWKRPIPTWHTPLYPYKSGPATLPRRLVALGDRVYVTLGLDAPLTALDAATGEIVQSYEGTAATEEVIESNGVLFLLARDDPARGNEFRVEEICMHKERNRVAGQWPWTGRENRIMAVRADTGDVLWSIERPVVPLTLAADRQGVYFHNGEKIVRLNRRNGDEVWRSEPVSLRSSIPTNFGPTLVLHEDVVLFSGGDRSMTSLSTKTGKKLWSAKHPRSGHNSPEDLLVVDGLVWSGAIANGKDSGVFTGRDPQTGEIKKQFGPDLETYWFHHRCYRSKATDRFLLPSRTGIEFVDVDREHWTAHHWVRGGCIYGIMPANGLVYAPPHSCACYIDAKLAGFCALAPASGNRPKAAGASEAPRLERGPAYGRTEGAKLNLESESDWPTYRHDAERSGRTKLPVPVKLKREWKTDVGGKLSSVVVAGGKVYVASVDAHTVYAIDENSGDTVWSYTTGGRVDSPPTVHQGRVLFGSADGWVYCLRAGDGELIWRFRAAPEDRRLMSYEQLESVWPVHGSVLVRDGVLSCVAGRSMFVDGGMRLVRLDPATGQKISETILDERDPESGQNLQAHVKVLNMPAALPDVLSSDGRSIYMRTQRFDLQGVRQFVSPTAVSEQSGQGRHLFSGAGFLDGSWFHRAYWTYGKSIASGANGWFLAGRHVPAGRLLVLGDTEVYGFGRKPQYFRWSTPLEYQLFGVGKDPEIVNTKTRRRGAIPETTKEKEKCAAPGTELEYRWAQPTDLLARAMVLAGQTLFVAGPPDVVDEEEAFRRPDDAEIQARLDAQLSALDGKKGALLRAVSTQKGERLTEFRLDSPPVWDGMAAAKGRLFIATTDGSVLCLSGR